MNKLRNKILSIMMIPVLLFSTASFSMDKHICSDIVYSVSVFGEAEDCGMEIDICDVDTSQSKTISNEDCCEDELQVIKGSIANTNIDVQLSMEQSLFITYFVISTYYIFKSDINKSDYYKDYLPPTISKDISSLFQVFII